jgi:hypothetical protein
LKENSSFQTVAAAIEDLYGTYHHLCADLQGAKEGYQNSLAIQPLPLGFEVALKLASVFVEIGTNEEVSHFFSFSSYTIDYLVSRAPPSMTKSLSALLIPPKISRGLGSRSIVSPSGSLGIYLDDLQPDHPSRSNENGKFHENALEKALECADVAITLTENLGETTLAPLPFDCDPRYRARHLCEILSLASLRETSSYPDSDQESGESVELDSVRCSHLLTTLAVPAGSWENNLTTMTLLLPKLLSMKQKNSLPNTRPYVSIPS